IPSSLSLSSFFSRLTRPPRPALFPYTTLFRSQATRRGRGGVVVARRLPGPAGHPTLTGAGGPRSDRAARTGWEGCRSRGADAHRSEEHTSELQSRENLVCRLLLEKKKSYSIQF